MSEYEELITEEFHVSIQRNINWFFRRYKMMASILSYIIQQDYDGMLIIPDDEWNSQIAQHKFSVGWRTDGNNTYITGVRNE